CLVGFIPLFAVETIEPELLDILPEFKARLEWFLEHRPQLASLVSRWHEPGMGERRLLALVHGHRMKRLLKRILDPEEFLSDSYDSVYTRIRQEYSQNVFQAYNCPLASGNQQGFTLC